MKKLERIIKSINKSRRKIKSQFFYFQHGSLIVILNLSILLFNFIYLYKII